jgi:hypothetical protein
MQVRPKHGSHLVPSQAYGMSQAGSLHSRRHNRKFLAGAPTPTQPHSHTAPQPRTEQPVAYGLNSMRLLRVGPILLAAAADSHQLRRHLRGPIVVAFQAVGAPTAVGGPPSRSLRGTSSRGPAAGRAGSPSHCGFGCIMGLCLASLCALVAIPGVALLAQCWCVFGCLASSCWHVHDELAICPKCTMCQRYVSTIAAYIAIVKRISQRKRDHQRVQPPIAILRVHSLFSVQILLHTRSSWPHLQQKTIEF